MKAWFLMPVALLVIGCSSSSGTSSDTHTIGDAMSSSSDSSGTKDAANMEADKTREKSMTGPDAASTSGEKKFEDDVFKVPIYAGAKEMPYTRLMMDTDASKSYNCTFQSSDDPDKIADFYKTEAAKVGKVVDLSVGSKPGTGFRVVAADVTDNEKLQIQIMKNPKDGISAISMHYIITKKK
ncbi:MAG: hypothetical protein GC165_09185 [Armatimonadetes bacterium]|nr:hypothetical protein [Armatimonadota bacterium]